jgi:Icc-related predicted phosphoesterase
VKILAISDEPSKAFWDYGSKERFEGIDLILSCGDLPIEYLEHITNFTTAPILYVHGNHDGCYYGKEPGGCTCVDGQVYTYKGLRIMGLGGSIRYNKADTYQYSEWAMKRRIAKLHNAARRVGGIDLLMTHSPAHGLNDGSDRAHRGFECFNALLDEYQPQWFVHGHIHLSYDSRLPRVCMRGNTTVINATERYVFEIPDPVQQEEPKKHILFSHK